MENWKEALIAVHGMGSRVIGFGWFAGLKHLNLSNSVFSGQVPIDLSHLSQLASLDLSGNSVSLQTSVVKRLFQNLTKLREHHLYFVNMSSVSLTSFMNLSSSLTSLTLEGCELCGRLPDTIFHLPNLLKLSLFGELPKSIGNLRFLRYLGLDRCNISGPIPASLGNLTQLTALDFSYKHFIGEIPSSLSNLKELSYLDLSYNNFSGSIPASLGNLTKVTEFYLYSNNFTGQIPSSLSNLKDLTIIDFSYNSFGERLPWQNLWYLDLRANLLQGNLSSVLEINMRMNSFQGTIPETLAKCTELKGIVFNGNQLEGLLPPSLVNCTELEVLDLGNNKINDSFPYWLEALLELHILVLRSNRFHGPIGNHKTRGMFFSKLQILDLSHNEFSGRLPVHYFGNMKAMMSNDEGKQGLQYLGEHYLTRYVTGGEIDYPYTVGVTVKGFETQPFGISTIFTTIDLSSHIPPLLANLSSLESLDLSSNRLMGEIPMQLTSLTFLAVLNLSQNQLTGPIPQGKQFDTFQNDSYYGNLGLCGPPLSIKCSKDASQPSPSIFQEANDSMFASGFGWKAVLMGYGCGFGFGLAVGYVFWFKTEKPQWLVRLFDGGNGKTSWPNNQRPRRRRS
uniref:Disease resistance R13L4/SHOC-2-like LRR domain-containing protein n=1 Tax=Fagus sylvatica TaxID=28930 RepID=A0A2N9EGC0_FAGSY